MYDAQHRHLRDSMNQCLHVRSAPMTLRLLMSMPATATKSPMLRMWLDDSFAIWQDESPLSLCSPATCSGLRHVHACDHKPILIARPPPAPNLRWLQSCSSASTCQAACRPPSAPALSLLAVPAVGALWRLQATSTTVRGTIGAPHLDYWRLALAAARPSSPTAHATPTAARRSGRRRAALRACAAASR
jgi:hypothetical protein